MCSAYAERDAHFVRDVALGSYVRLARETAERITSLCAVGAILHLGDSPSFTKYCLLQVLLLFHKTSKSALFRYGGTVRFFYFDYPH